MEKRIELEKRHKTPDQVTELNLDNCKGCTAVAGLTDEFVNLHTLSLIGSGLTSLKGFPKLPKLEKLELSDNKISGGLQILKGCEALTTLNLSGNRIKDLTTLQDLKDLPNLRVLDLFNNEVTSVDDYRNKMFDLLPQLTYLDGSDRNGKEYEESDDEDEEDEDDDEEDDPRRIIQNAKPSGLQVPSLSDEEWGDGGEGNEEESEEEEAGLKDLYDDNLEDDGSDAYEQEEEEEEDNDISDDSALEADGENRVRSANNSSAALDKSSVADGENDDSCEEEEEAEESTSGKEAPRGTKRKLEEEEGEPGGDN